jgi:16S rRNA C967 or C1407 C5-methylase (RsmB/RsmF family)/NOL1/NOP2/fmu family ribosome biogenesis protein
MPLPSEFERATRAQLGPEYPAFTDSFRVAPPVSIRLHPIKGKHSISDDVVPWSTLGRYLPSRPSFTLDPLFHAGSYYVQEASSMFLEQALQQTLNLNEPMKVLDLCAAPGGKSTHILSLINRESLLVSNETIRARASILAENVQKWGYPNAVVTSNDPAHFKSLPGFFDVVVVDAPCSGEGLFRKEPEAVGEWSPESVQLCASRQKRILADVWDSLREGGLLIYCTCTYNTLENESNLQWLIENYSVEFQKIAIDPSWGVTEIDERGAIGYRFFPHKVKGEGFFLTAIRKLDPATSVRTRSNKILPEPSKKVVQNLQSWLHYPDDSRYFQFNNVISFVPASVNIDTLSGALRIVSAGTAIASVKHDKLVPEHTMALSTEINVGNFPTLDLDETQALKYLRRESIETENVRAGFALVTHKDTPLGWVNVLSNRINNMYPSQWRIRMSG